MTKIIVDTKGGDLGEAEMIKGGAAALEKFSGLHIVFAGNKESIEDLCAREKVPCDRFGIIDAPGEISNYDDPADALYHKTDSSMLKAMQELSARDDLFGMISCGNTGVLLTGAMRYLSGAERIRPALAALLPAQNGSLTCLVDTGATVDCNPPMLRHFARLGSGLMKSMYGIAEPRIGLLSNGSESSKGNKLVKETYPILEADEELNFIGNVEGNNALSGVCDVLVCDGFAGNQVLKVTEGTAMRIIKDIFKYAHKTGSEEVKALGAHLMKIYDIGSLGGGTVLGIKKPVIKARGSADASAVVNISEMLLNMAENKAMFDSDRNRI